MESTTVGMPETGQRGAYWENRYSVVNSGRSGHLHLPPSYNAWLYQRKMESLRRGFRFVGVRLSASAVLETAVGSGAYMPFWQANKVTRLAGIDLSEAAIESLQERFPHHVFRRFDLSQPGLAAHVGTEWDVVTAIDVLYYLIDDAGFEIAIENCAETVRLGGHLVLHVPIVLGTDRVSGNRKLRTYDRYRTALQKSGIDIVWSSPTFFFSVRPQRAKPGWANLRLMSAIWRRVTYPLVRRFPHAAGKVTHGIDRTLALLHDEGPSYQMIIGRRVR